MPRRIPKDEIIRDIQKFAQGNGDLTLLHYKDVGTFDYKTILRCCGSWNRALREAGVTPQRVGNKPLEGGRP